MMKIKEKLKEYLSVKKITKLEFYNNINVANGYLDKDGAINSDILATILIKYSDININWLLFGEENMFMKNQDLDISSQPSCGESCKLKDYIIDLQKEKIKLLEKLVL